MRGASPLRDEGRGPNVRAMKNGPLIGITADWEEPSAYSNKPWYAIRQNYCTAVEHAGGMPVVLPHGKDTALAYAGILDGVVISGGNFDVDPALFGATSHHATVKTKDARTGFETALTKAALARNIPVLGICGGQQLLNVVLGGTLIQHIPDAVEDALAHEQPNPRDEPGHNVSVVAGTLLHRIVGTAEMSVNSAHHQAVENVAGDVVINATAPDGVIEGIESAAYKFCLGVQWHPEYSIDPGDQKIFDAFVKAAKSK